MKNGSQSIILRLVETDVFFIFLVFNNSEAKVYLKSDISCVTYKLIIKKSLSSLEFFIIATFTYL